jgi:hypothetical protein
MHTTESVKHLMYSESRPWKINHEKVFNALNNIIKDPIYGAEIGVAYAGNSFNLLKNFKNLTLYSIDPYVKYSDEDKTSDSVEGENGNILYKIVSNTLKENFKERSFFIRANSNCLIDFKNEFFDFIFIDGDHTYEGCSSDINNSFSKVKKGGILIGDDYGVFEHINFRVRKAVDEFCLNNKYELNRDEHIWWIVK